MENASKALIMAAGVLIGIMILSIAVYLFATFGATSADVHQQNEANRVNQFNTQFTSYEGKINTIYDVITAANLATTNNEEYELLKVSGILNNPSYPDFYVQVYLRNDDYMQTIEGGFESPTTADYNAIIANDTNKITTNSENKLDTYTCTTYISNVTQRVYRVDFIKN